MQQVTKEEIRRVNKIHRRADEAVQQLTDGHIITELIALHPDESPDGKEIKWNSQDLELWPDRKLQLIGTLASHNSTTILSVTSTRARDVHALHSSSLAMDQEFQRQRAKGLIMFRQSEAFLAAVPPPDPYTKGDRAGR